jgi:hypothetical protein
MAALFSGRQERQIAYTLIIREAKNHTKRSGSQILSFSGGGEV